MRWFGPPRGREPFASGYEFTDVPVGQPCGWCAERLEDDDSGVTMNGVKGGNGHPYQFERVAFHWECHARQLIGSLAHLQRRCSCYVKGATCTDPPDMTKRQAAQAALEFFQRGCPHNLD